MVVVDVMLCVVNVVLDVDIVVIYGCCDGVIYGEILVALSVWAGCDGGSSVMILLCEMMRMLWLLLLMLW